MAALQQSPVALQAKSPPSSTLTQTQTQTPIRLSFSSTIPSLKLTTTSPRHRQRNLGITASLAAASYAGALADVAKSKGTLEATVADIEKIEQVFSDSQTFNFFNNPTISIEKKREVVDKIASSLNLQPHSANFLSILVDVKRTEIVNEIVKEFEIVYNKMTDTEFAIVTSVVKLEAQHLAQIAKQVQKLTGGKNVRIKSVIDPALVAGFTIKYGSSGSKMIDMSVKKQLEDIASQLDLSDISLAV
ncbi:hypothetical protein GIB67_026157 [Kingdonia uniflora]|uniref:ATP synthase delta chain, chloroplastic n=1 Tax=Kingdonia uniflora TaxID=39325 RepID=A0A7J7M354_9MAGN|nr:hypothetical protein GIB67_026157 [Kingdonia uniflora]